MLTGFDENSKDEHRESEANARYTSKRCALSLAERRRCHVVRFGVIEKFVAAWRCPRYGAQVLRQKTLCAGEAGTLYGLAEQDVYDSSGGVAVPFFGDATCARIAVQN